MSWHRGRAQPASRMTDMQDTASNPSGTLGDPGIQPGIAIRLSARVRRLTAPNPGAMTGPGTNSYLIDAGRHCAIIDPGPADDRHTQALLDAAPAGAIRYILVTHTHRDHSPGAAALKSATGALVLGQTTPHRHWQDPTFAPDGELEHDARLTLAPGATLRVIHTPGHASNHLCFLLEEEHILFTGDHIIQGSTVVIDPPDGDMAAYLRSLQSLLREPLEYLAPGHGALIAHPHAAIQALIQHRLRREAKVLAALPRRQPADLPTLVRAVYDDVPPHLHALAERSLLAHLIKLQAESRARRVADSWIASH
jgi:glyoxylase-like metal-dependent hydrolase (beta-lactamase superfamily II)